MAASLCWFICFSYKKTLQIGQACERKKAESYKSNFITTLYQVSHSLHRECICKEGARGGEWWCGALLWCHGKKILYRPEKTIFLPL